MNSQKGFTTLETILLVIVTGLVVAGGFYVYNVRSQNAEPKKATSQSTVTPNKLDEEKVESTVDSFYKEYVAQVNPDIDMESENRRTREVVVKYGSDKLVKFYDEPKQYDPIYCNQNSPNGYKVGAVKVTGNKAVVDVSTSFDSYSWDFKVIVNSDYRIDSVDCPDVRP